LIEKYTLYVRDEKKQSTTEHAEIAEKKYNKSIILRSLSTTPFWVYCPFPISFYDKALPSVKEKMAWACDGTGRIQKRIAGFASF
jgi:uncharacterized protein YhbP (UPF0306 family)